jgi:ribosome-associated toxin RatA of RatAB toxin-antitoxin module
VDTSIRRRIRAGPDVIFRLAARVEDWPRLLPHYRWVRVLEERGPAERLVDMAATRPVAAALNIPLHWTSIQRIDWEQHRIFFDHVGGISRGMHVSWSVKADSAHDGHTDVSIRHVFRPNWPVPDPILSTIAGDYFVNGVARRTLAMIAAIAESVPLVESS